jgi:hypothetical protein
MGDRHRGGDALIVRVEERIDWDTSALLCPNGRYIRALFATYPRSAERPEML